ncbi:hypothetical protein PV328_004951 [Microctonus aethiopoides]|uniref:GH18 domain-containing protein n=1 Tax=Microctonus aethiopoides TaxID=144406 RepID=A0AA39KM97_9HYME|nr:hypothetical protein PV328_004951 [Microctonus aethiopoides]
MINKIPVPQAKYKLLNSVQEKRWRSPVFYLISLLLIIIGILFITRGWFLILTAISRSTESRTINFEDATIAAWSCRARMYAESSKENQDADRNTTVTTANSSTSFFTSSKIVVCYYTISSNMNTSWELSPAHIDPYICTHIIVGFASVVNCTISLGTAEELLQQIINLKLHQPKLKVMVSASGINELQHGFPEMVKTHANRKLFIKSVLNLTRVYNLDGLDIDWEFPVWLGANDRQRIWFIQLLQETKKEFDRSGRNLTLSAAVASPVAIIDESYNVPEIAEHVDFINLMSYDYHYYVWYLPLTGLNAPMYAKLSDSGYAATLNVNYSAMYWVSKGMPREKIVIGIPTYGHSFKLDNVNNHGIMAPAKGFGHLGISGFTLYPTVCWFINTGANKVYDKDSRTPYVYKDDEWISYDDTTSVLEKVRWINANGFKGAMVFSLNTDDWNATCDKKNTFPLTRVIAANIIGLSSKNTASGS